MSLHGPQGRWQEVREAPSCAHQTFHHGHRACRSPLPTDSGLPANVCLQSAGEGATPVHTHLKALLLFKLHSSPCPGCPLDSLSPSSSALAASSSAGGHKRRTTVCSWSSTRGSYLIHRKYLFLRIRSHDFTNPDSI